jgi:hypothetical protein
MEFIYADSRQIHNRHASRISNSNANRLRFRLTRRTATSFLPQQYAQEKFRQKMPIPGANFQSKSPSCPCGLLSAGPFETWTLQDLQSDCKSASPGVFSQPNTGCAGFSVFSPFSRHSAALF